MDDDRSRTLQSEATRLADAARDRAAGTLEDVKVASSQIVDKVRDLIEEGNVRRISLRKGDRVLFEIPLTVGVGAGAAALLTSPLLAAVGAVAALVSDITIAVERDDDAADRMDDSGDAASKTPASGGDAQKADAAPSKTAGPAAGKPDAGTSEAGTSDAGTSDASHEHVANVNEPGKSEHDAGKTVGKPSSGDA